MQQRVLYLFWCTQYNVWRCHQEALYMTVMTAFSRHSPLRGQFAELRQLQGWWPQSKPRVFRSLLSTKLGKPFSARPETLKSAEAYS